MDCIVHGVAKSWTRLRDFHFLLFPWVAEEFLQSHYISFWRMHRGFRGFSLSVYTVWLGMGRVEPRGAGSGLPRFTRDAKVSLYVKSRWKQGMDFFCRPPTERVDLPYSLLYARDFSSVLSPVPG